MIVGYIGLIFGGMAISFKLISEAVSDTMIKRLYPPTAADTAPTASAAGKVGRD